jgi:hypothetical protein
MAYESPELKEIGRRLAKLEAAWEGVLTFVGLYFILIAAWTWAPNVLLNHPLPIPPEILWALPYALGAIVYFVKRFEVWSTYR